MKTSGGQRRWVAKVWAAAACVVVAVIVAACGGSTSVKRSAAASSSASTKVTAQVGASLSAAGTAEASNCQSQAKSALATLNAPMKLVVPSASINMAANKGKSVWFISPTQTAGYVRRVSEYFAAAAKAAGMKPTVFDGKDEPERFNQGIDQAVASKAAGIVMWAIPPEAVPNALAQAKAAGIPVVAAATGVPNPTNGTLAETISVNLEEEGAALAEIAASELGCKVNAAITLDTSQKALTTEASAAKAELAKLCPSTCKSQEQTMSLATMATALGPATQTLLQREPELNALLVTFDTAAFYMAPAIAQTGHHVTLVSTDGLPENLDLVREGKQAADVSYPPAEYAGWLMLDQVGRAILKAPLENPEMPLHLFDKKNLPSSNSFNALWPEMSGYQAAFEAKWKG